MEPVLRVEGVTKRYGEVIVLDDVSFDLPRGRVTLLTGRSGSGKSTLFKLLAGLDVPTSGSIIVDGVDITTLDDHALSQIRLRRMGLVFQSFNLLPELSALENVRLPMDLAGVKRAEATARAGELLALVSVDHRAHARPNALSGGEQQRVALARALTNRPEIILADEPTGNLDRKNACNVLDVFREVNRALGTAILIVTHDDLAIQSFPDRFQLVEGSIMRGDEMLAGPDLRGSSGQRR